MSTLTLGTGTGLEFQRVFAVGAGYVAWYDGSGLMLAPASGATPPIRVDTGAISAIAVEGDSLFWAVTNPSTFAGVLKRRPLRAEVSTAPTELPVPVRGITSLLVTADRYYWIDTVAGVVRTATRADAPSFAVISELPAGYSHRALRMRDLAGVPTLYWEQFSSSGARPCYGINRAPASPRPDGVPHVATAEFRGASDVACTAATFTGFDLDAEGVVFHDPTVTPTIRSSSPSFAIGPGRGDGTALGIWRGCVIAYNGSGFTAVERRALGRSRVLPTMTGGGVFTVQGDSLYALVGRSSAFSVVRIDL